MWKCYKCKVDVEEVDDIKIFYKDLSLPDACGYRCPSAALSIWTASSWPTSSPPRSRCLRANKKI